MENEISEIFSLFNFIEEYPKGSVLFSKNDKVDCAFYLISGSVEVNQSEGKKDTLSDGQILNSMEELKSEEYERRAVALTDCVAALIDCHTFLYVLNKNLNLRDLVEGKSRLYEIPDVGLMYQYETTFKEKLALGFIVQKKNDEIIKIIKGLSEDTFSINYDPLVSTRKVFFQNKKSGSREIFLNDGLLVGLSSNGQWDDFDHVIDLVYAKQKLDEAALDSFAKSGSLF